MSAITPEPPREARDGMKPLVLYLARDLFFSMRLADGLARLGAEAQKIDAIPVPALQDAALFLVDLSSPQTQWQPLIERAHQAGIPVLAFGSHMDQPRWKVARVAGAIQIVANSHLIAHFPELVGRLLHPPAS